MRWPPSAATRRKARCNHKAQAPNGRTLTDLDPIRECGSIYFNKHAPNGFTLSGVRALVVRSIHFVNGKAHSSADRFVTYDTTHHGHGGGQAAIQYTPLGTVTAMSGSRAGTRLSVTHFSGNTWTCTVALPLQACAADKGKGSGPGVAENEGPDSLPGGPPESKGYPPGAAQQRNRAFFCIWSTTDLTPSFHRDGSGRRWAATTRHRNLRDGVGWERGRARGRTRE